MTIKELIDLTHAQVLTIRNLQYLVATEEFKDFYTALNTHERGEVIHIILKGNLDALKAFMEKKKPKPLEEHTVADLRAMVREYGVEQSHLMNKLELLGIIYARRKQEVDSRNGFSGNGVVQDKNMEALDWIG